LHSVHFSSARHDWNTPRDLFADLHREFAFTIDVCATSESACLRRFLTERDEGLMHSWAGERVWCNPPYGRQIARWMEKVWTEAEHAELIVALVPSRTDTRWWHDYAMKADDIRFLRGRLRFVLMEAPGRVIGNAPFPSALVIYGAA
jgi:phage N-6-adenine-methyltransferase